MGSMTVLPAAHFPELSGKTNGALAADILAPIPGGRLLVATARKWIALRGICLEQTGHTLHPTSSADTYRPMATQVNLFESRYIPEPAPGLRPAGTVPSSRKGPWKGRYWWKRSGVATAALPGTSNHGWGRAIDAGVLINGRVVTISTDPDGAGPIPRLIEWLTSGPALGCGFSWEVVPEEPWHLRDVTGPTIPAAVLAWEAAQHPSTTPPPAPEPVTPPTFPPFDPAWGAWGLFPLVPHHDRPRLSLGSGYGGGPDFDWVRYLQGVLRIKCGQVAVSINGIYDEATALAVWACKAFFAPGSPIDMVVTADWAWVDLCAGTP